MAAKAVEYGKFEIPENGRSEKGRRYGCRNPEMKLLEEHIYNERVDDMCIEMPDKISASRIASRYHTYLKRYGYRDKYQVISRANKIFVVRRVEDAGKKD